MITDSRLSIADKRFVVLEESEYDRLRRQARAYEEDDVLPPLPQPDKKGRYPALEYARISLARDLVRDRTSAGLSQQALARLAGIRQETLSRIERAKHTANPKTVAKIAKALERFARRQGKK